MSLQHNLFCPKPGNGFYFFPQKVNKNSRLSLMLLMVMLKQFYHFRTSQGRIGGI
jgi:hypothetical protein